MSGASSLQLTDYIRAIPDFPKPGIMFRDITPLLSHPQAFRQAVSEMARWAEGKRIGVVAAAEARGFLLAAPLALQIGASLIPIRKKGKLPFRTLSHTYDLEYGCDTLEIHEDAIPPGAEVLVVDDVLATGGTMDACCRLVEKAGGRVAGCEFLIELVGLGGLAKIDRYSVFSLIKFD
jgi:adenine phosphoribosyltransferase